MQATKQQQIMGFFIEEAKEHLDTIEQGLIDLKSTLADPEQLNELFRAAHSIKGGAAMLGFSSIQRVAHHLEDSFKILKDNLIKPDRKLEDLFLKGFDTLKELVEALQSPYGLQTAQGEQIVQQAQPNFIQLNQYLNQLHQQSSAGQPAVKVNPDAPVLINAVLKKMLQLFKQGDSAACRQQVTTLCSRMVQLSTSTEWRDLLQVTQTAIANPKNSYPTLAPLVIKELKQAGDRLIAGCPTDIAINPALQQMARVSTVAIAAKPAAVASRSTSATEIPVSTTRPRQITIPLEPRTAARALLDAFNKEQLIELAEFLMKAIQ